MRIRIIRGQDQIGGSIIEVASGNARIILDVGSELEESKPQPPDVNGLFSGEPTYDAVFVTHYHGDHIGLAGFVLPSIPVYLGEAALRIYAATRDYRSLPIPANIRPYTSSEHMTIGPLTVTPHLCDHSAFDSYMLLIEADGKRLLYTGDFRSNGRKSFKALLNRLPTVDALIVEGTTLSGSHEKAWTEYDLERHAVDLIKAHQGSPVFVMMAATNIDRLVSIYKAARKAHRTLLLDVYSASIASAAGGFIPRPGTFSGIKTFLTVPSEKNHTLLEMFGKAKIGRNAIARTSFVMVIRDSMRNYLKKLSEQLSFKDGLLLYSLWSGYREQESIAEFLEFMESRGVSIRTLHTSGHADEEAISALVEHVAPKIIIPVHTENASWFDRFKGAKVCLLESEVEL